MDRGHHQAARSVSALPGAVRLRQHAMTAGRLYYFRDVRFSALDLRLRRNRLCPNGDPDNQVALGLNALSRMEPYFHAGRQIAYEFVKLSGV